MIDFSYLPKLSYIDLDKVQYFQCIIFDISKLYDKYTTHCPIPKHTLHCWSYFVEKENIRYRPKKCCASKKGVSLKVTTKIIICIMALYRLTMIRCNLLPTNIPYEKWFEIVGNFERTNSNTTVCKKNFKNFYDEIICKNRINVQK